MSSTPNYDFSDPLRWNQVHGITVGLIRQAYPTLTQAPSDICFAGAMAELVSDVVDPPAAGHTHPISDIIGLQTALDGKAALSHTHAISDIISLQTALDGKASLVHSHVIADVVGLQTALDGKAAASHTHAATDIVSGTLAAARLPVATTAAFGAVQVDNNSAGTPIALTSAGHGSAADPHSQYALDSEKGAPSGLATLDATSKLTSSQLPLGTSGSQACAGNDSRLTDSRTPLAHAASHKSGGSDAIKLDELAATTDVTTLNASTSAHGLLPKLPSGTDKVLRGDGTYGAKVLGNANTADVTANAADTYLTGSNIAIAGFIKAGTVFRWRFRMTKTGAGVATPIWNVRVGTAASTADTARVTLTSVAQTGVIDDGWVDLEVIVRTNSASGVIEASFIAHHTLVTTGLQNVQTKTLQGVSGAFDITAASLQIGVSCNPGSLGVWTFQHVSAEAFNLA